MPIICPRCDESNHGNRKTCWNCGSSLSGVPHGARTFGGALGGAILGASVGGPPGAVIGALIGYLLGSASEDEEEED